MQGMRPCVECGESMSRDPRKDRACKRKRRRKDDVARAEQARFLAIYRQRLRDELCGGAIRYLYSWPCRLLEDAEDPDECPF